MVVPAWRLGRASGFPAEVPDTGPTRIWLASVGCGFAGWAGTSSQRWLLCKPARRSMRVGQFSFWLVAGAAW